MIRPLRPLHHGFGLLLAAMLAAGSVPVLAGVDAGMKDEPTMIRGKSASTGTVGAATLGKLSTKGEKPKSDQTKLPKKEALDDAGKGEATAATAAKKAPTPKPTKAAKPSAPAEKSPVSVAKAQPKTKAKPVSSKTSTNPTARRVAALEAEAKRIAAALTPTQKSKLLVLLNEASAEELAAIVGVGKSRSEAIEKARPIDAIEEVRNVKGVGSKTFEGVVDHGKTLTATRSKSGSASKTTDAPQGSARPRSKSTAAKVEKD